MSISPTGTGSAYPSWEPGEFDDARTHTPPASSAGEAAASSTTEAHTGPSALDVRSGLGIPALDTEPIGEDGRFDSRLETLAPGTRLETIDLVTDRNPNGVELEPGTPFYLPRRLDEGVYAVRGYTREGTPVRAHIGRFEFAETLDEVPRGRQPILGRLRLESDLPATLERVEVVSHTPGSAETTDYVRIDEEVRAGERYEIPIPRARQGKRLDQIELMWTAHYNVPDPSGARSDEGKPMWLDGVYADIFMVEPDGNERKIDWTKFVDEEEVDNLHDLSEPAGRALAIRFFAKNPEGESKAIELRGVRFRYEDEAEPSTPPFSAAIGREFDPGEVAEITLPPSLRDKPIGRVEVRWTDMLSGTWKEPGYASGRLMIDGEPVGDAETVQSPETQTFSYLGGIVAREGRVGVRIEDDRARVDEIRVFFNDAD